MKVKVLRPFLLTISLALLLVPFLYSQSAGTVTSNSTGKALVFRPHTAAIVIAQPLAPVVPIPPTITEQFVPAVTVVNGGSTATFTIVNTAPTPVTGLTFSDHFPSAIFVKNPPNITNSCGGSVSSDSSNVSLSGGAMPGGSSCTVTIDVGTATAGTFNNRTSALSCDQTGSGATSNFAQLVVNMAQTTINLNSSVQRSGFQSTVTLTTTVVPDPVSGRNPGGSVQFLDESNNVLATIPLSSRMAVYSFTRRGSYNHTLHAVYSGDSNFVGSRSGPVRIIFF